MVLSYVFKKLLLVGTIINLSNAEISSSTADAISEVRFVQYTPLAKKLQASASSNTGSFKELDARETGYHQNSLDRPFIPNKSSYGETDEEKTVPKNYAFSYAIRDRNSGDDFSHTQAHNGEATKGEYRVKLPDGRTQIVRYTADNGGYRADIRYDNDEMEGQSNNGVYVSQRLPEQVSPSIKQPTNVNLPTKFVPNLHSNGIGSRKISDKISDSPRVYFNQVRSFGVPSSTTRPASYETVENTDEELFPYSKKLLDDVNYLLKYVTPTIESKHENKNFADYSKNKFLNDDPYFKEKFKDEPLQYKDKFQLPPNFPYQFSKFEEPKFEKLTFNGPNIDENTFIEPSLIGLKHEEHTIDPSRFEKSRQESQKNTNQGDSSRSSEFKFNSPISNGNHFDTKPHELNFREQSFENTNLRNGFDYNSRPKEETFQRLNFDERPRYDLQNEGQNFAGPNLDERLKLDDPKLNGQLKKLNFDSKYNTPSEGLRFNLGNFDNSKYDESRLEGQNVDIPKQNENYVGNVETSKFELPQFDGNFELAKNEPHDFTPSHFEGAKYESQNFNDAKFTVPQLPKVNLEHFNQGSQSNSAKVEIPQYIHIHRYEASGEDQSNNARPKELIYYNPLQIPVPNSITYMEQGTYNYSDPKYVTLTPSYITMTEHPRIQPTNAPAMYFHSALDTSPKLTNFSKFQENYFEPTPVKPLPLEFSTSYEYQEPQNNPPEPPLNLSPVKINLPQNQVTTENTIDNHDNYENTIGALPPFDPRTYSGYFDFLPADEDEGENEKLAPVPSYPSTTEQSDKSKNELPQYYYDFSTASPINKYVSSAEASQEQFKPGFDTDQIRNTSFLASAYLRPLHKERVYIHHNSQPTTPSDENFIFPATTIEPKQARKEPDVQIIKSISSTIPPELLKDFDYQLSSSVFSSNDNTDANSERKEIKISPETRHKLNTNIVKKLQSALATNGKVYLKTPTQQKYVVR